MDWQIIRAYVDHFLPREVIGPVIIVFSLESVVSGIFELYVPPEYALLGWAAIFVFSIVVVAYWGSTRAAGEDLQERIEEVQENETNDGGGE